MGFFDSLILSALADQPNLTELECQKEIEALKKHQLEIEKKVKEVQDYCAKSMAGEKKLMDDFYAAHPNGPIRTDLHLDPKRLP